jgi:hypothetical protein
MKRKISLSFEIPEFRFWKKEKSSGGEESPEVCFEPKRKIWRKIVPFAVIVALSFWLGEKYDFTPLGFVIFAYFLAALWFHLDSRISAALALILLVVCPVALGMKQEELADQAAVYTYYFLVIYLAQEIASMAGEKIKQSYFGKD